MHQNCKFGEIPLSGLQNIVLKSCWDTRRTNAPKT